MVEIEVGYSEGRARVLSVSGDFDDCSTSLSTVGLRRIFANKITRRQREFLEKKGIREDVIEAMRYYGSVDGEDVYTVYDDPVILEGKILVDVEIVKEGSRRYIRNLYE